MAQPQSTYFTYATAHGPITIRATRRGVAEIAFEQVKLEGTCTATETTNATATQIQEYLAGKRRVFDVPIDMQGSAFQKAVWTEVCAVPYGQTRTAADIAEAGAKRGSTRWRDELIARSVARSYAGAHVKLTREGALQLVDELMSTRQPYVCPRNKPTMFLTSIAELTRKFDI